MAKATWINIDPSPCTRSKGKGWIKEKLEFQSYESNDNENEDTYNNFIDDGYDGSKRMEIMFFVCFCI